MSESFLNDLLDMVDKGRLHPEDAAFLLSSSDDTLIKRDFPIAIISMACRFPKANNLEEFWLNLKSGKDCITEIPDFRWSKENFYSPGVSKPSTSYSKWGGFIEDIDKFDNDFFGMTKKEAEYMDPQQRLFLELSFETFERAGYSRKELNGKNIGVFVGARAGSYQSFDYRNPKTGMVTGNMANFIPGRVSDFFNLKGPSMAIDTACSSSLVAVHIACKSLITGDCSMAIAGGVELKISPYTYITLSQIKALSPDGKCRVFDKTANGFVPGEGVGAVLLKPLHAALKDRDIIHSVIVKTASNNDGHSMGRTSPNVLGQKDVLNRIYKNSKIKAETISMIEAHGTGTTIGDPIEIKALSEVFSKFSKKKGCCALGSLKTNIGHLDTAAGIAGLIKVILALKHKLIPPTLHCNEPNPRFDFINSPFYINDSLRKCESFQGNRRAGVSSFGFGGTNCHMVVEEAPLYSKNGVSVSGNNRHEPFVLSTCNKEALYKLINKYRSFICTIEENDFSNLCFSTFALGNAYPHRLAICSDSLKSLKSKFDKIQDQKLSEFQPDSSIFCSIAPKKSDKVVFMFSGQGEQYQGMGKDLYQSSPQFKRNIQDCADILDPFLEICLVDSLFNVNSEVQKETFITQLIIFTIDYALAKLWISWDLIPGCVIGHSLGEYIAGCIAGMFNLEDGLKMVLKRGQLMQDCLQRGTMAAVFANSELVDKYINQLKRENQGIIAIACVNSPRNVVVSGNEDTVGYFLGILKAEGVQSQYIEASRAFHSPVVTPILKKYQEILREVDFKPANIPFMSTILAKNLKTSNIDYWLQHNIKPVLFYPAVNELLSEGYSTFLEVGPGRSLANLIKTISKRKATVLTSLDPRKKDWNSMHSSVSQLYVKGLNINPYNSLDNYQRLELPTYPFSKKSFWVNQDFNHFWGISNSKRKASTLNHNQIHPLIDGCSSISEKKAVYYKKLAYNHQLLQDHVLKERPTIAGTVWIEAVYQASCGFLKNPVTGLKEVMFLTPLQLKKSQKCLVEIQIEKTGEKIEFLVRSRIEDNNNEWKIHVKGFMITSSLPESKNVDIGYIRSKCSKIITGENIYTNFQKKAGIYHGPFFKGIHSVECTHNEILAELRLSEENTNAAHLYNFHPGLLDSAVQGLYALAGKQKDNPQITITFIPFYFEKILFYAPVNSSCMAVARVFKTTSEIAKFDLSIIDTHGRVMVQMVNASSKRIPSNKMISSQSQIPDHPLVSSTTVKPFFKEKEWFFKIKWEKANLPEKSEFLPERWLIFALKTPLHNRFLSQISEKGQEYLTVFPNSQFNKVNEKNYTLQSESKQDYQRLFENISKELPTIKGIIFLWPFSIGQDFNREMGGEDQDQWAISLLYISQVLIQKKVSLDLWIITSFAQTIHNEEKRINPLKAIFWGMSGVINKEIPSITCRCIDVNPLTDDYNCEKLVGEINVSEKSEKVLYYNGHRYIPRLEKLNIQKLKGSLLIKKQGVYIITGGLGGIGIQIAKYLAKTVKANLVLVGRSSLPPEDKWNEYTQSDGQNGKITKTLKDILEIKKLSSDVLVYSVDITDYEKIKMMFDKVREKFGKIDGIIHSAGINEDSLIINKDIQSFKRVLGPKVQGTWNLDRLSVGENLDFFIMFSSIAAIEGNISQVDYAAANAFLDAFALWRGKHRNDVSLSIDWGLWKNIGMSANVNTLKHVKRSDIMSFKIDEGIWAFSKVLNGVNGQMIINSAPMKKIRSLKNELKMDIENIGHEEFLEKILNRIITQYIDEDLPENEREGFTFLELGMDSESLIEMIHKLENYFEIKLYPTLFFEYQNISELSKYLIAEFPNEIKRKTREERNEKQANQKEYKLPEALSNESYSVIRHMNLPERIEPKSSRESSKPVSKQHVAIIGYSLRVPGADNPEEYWKNLSNGIETVSEIPQSRWNWKDFYDSIPGISGKSYCIKGAFLRNIDKFDPLFFNISPKEAMVMDPRQRLFLEVGWECLEHAGYCGEHLNERTGVFVGTSYNYYFDNIPNSERSSTFASIGNGLPLIPNRFSFFLNFNGPSFLVDTYCSSSLVALNVAYKSILNNECDMALVGGIHAPLTPDHYINTSQMEVLSPDGHCRTFDDRANGYVPGEGFITVLLKPLGRAIQDNDYIHGVIIGSSVNHGGHSNHITAPNAASQSQVIIGAIKNSNIDPETISYIEAHGTGTALGDPVEIQGLSKAFSSFTNKKSFCAIGSVKSNIGHLESASGLVGLVKILLSLKSKKIPPTLHFNKLNKYINIMPSPFYINDKLCDWEYKNGKRRAGLSSFGLTGTNSHVIIEEMPESHQLSQPAKMGFPDHILTLSAKNQETLERLTHRYEKYLTKDLDHTLDQICYTANTGRKHFECKLAIVASHKESMHDKIRLYILNKREDLSNNSGIFADNSKKQFPLVFFFPGHIWSIDIWKYFYEGNQLFRDKLHVIDQIISSIADFSVVQILDFALLNKIKKNSKQEKLLVFGIFYALTQVFIHLGVKPRFSYGIGIGQFVAAAIATKHSIKETLEYLIQDKNIQIKNNCSPSFFSAEKFSSKSFIILSFGDFSEQISGDSKLVKFTLRRGKQWKDVLNAIASLYVKGAEISWKTFYQDFTIKKIPLPTYPFQRKRYWSQKYKSDLMQNEKPVQKKDVNVLDKIHVKGRTVYYRKTWKPIEILENEQFTPGKVWLVFSDYNEIVNDLKKLLEKNNQKIILARSNEKFLQIDSSSYGINMRVPEDYARLQNMVSDQFGDIFGILYLWSSSFDKNWIDLSEEKLETLFYSGVYPLFFIIKTFLAIPKNYKKSIPKFFTISIGEIENSKEHIHLSPDVSALSAILKTASIELDSLNRLIGFDPHGMPNKKIVENILIQLKNNGNHSDVFYRNNQPFIPFLEPLNEISEVYRPVLKERGVYLIIGGCTGVGSKIALYLASTYRARLAIVGRTTLPDKSIWEKWILEKGKEDAISRRIIFLQQVKQETTDCIYFDADVSVLSKMERVVEEIRKIYGAIDGVIHSGGVIDDALIQDKDFKSFQNVWRTKTLGTIVLNRVTEKEDLDFFVVFSSISALLGNPGQSDYAAANAFMDSLMVERSQTGKGKSLSINWTYWQDGGMDIPKAGLKKMEMKGILPLDTGQALQAFLLSLQQNQDTNIAVVNRKKDFNGNLFSGYRVQKMDDKENLHLNKVSTPSTKYNLNERTENFLFRLIKDLLLIDENEIDPDAHFEEFGVDSLVMKKMIREIEDFIKRPVEPSSLIENSTIHTLANHLGDPPSEIETNEINKQVVSPCKNNETKKKIIGKPEHCHQNENRIYEGAEKDIAVIGFSCRFPGAKNIEEFWRNLKEEVYSVTEVPKERWDVNRFYSPDFSDVTKTYSRWGGFIDGVEQFDPSFFNIKEEDAAMLDPQQRIALEIAWKTFEHAGYSKKSIWGTPIGVFFGARKNRYHGLLNDSRMISGFLTGQLTNFISTRISNFFNLKGPSMTIDTACSSSLVSIHYACKSLLTQECEMAFAGGSEIKVTPYPIISLSVSQALSYSGKSYVFDKKADGFVPGEGVGAVLLKPLKKAMRDNDYIYAVIKGSSVNNDGHTMGITTPNMEAQKEVIQSALKDSGVNPETISYVEAHGTGTLIGDPIEIKALSNVFEKFTNRKNYCGIGSVKTNIGHLDTAAGISSFIKVVLSLLHNQLPATLHCTQPNPRFSFVDSPFYPNTALRSWDPIQGVRRAGISSFGFGGTNCHMVLEEALVIERNKKINPSNKHHLFILTARTNRAIENLTTRYLKFFDSNDHLNIEDVCFTVNTGREFFPIRRALVCKDILELKEKLLKSKGDSFSHQMPPPKVVFLFPGQGALYPGMIKELYQTVPSFSHSLNSCFKIMSLYLDYPIQDYLDRADIQILKETSVTQPLTFAINYSLAKMWMEWGVKPWALIGHSIGEFVAACLAGVFNLEDALKIVCARGRLMQKHCRRGSMAVLFTNLDHVKNLLLSLPIKESEMVTIAGINGPNNIVISGESPIINKLLNSAKEDRIRSHMLNVSHAFHSPLMDPVLAEFSQIFDEIEIKKNTIPLFCNVTGQMIENEQLGKEYWLKHIKSTVQFAKSIEQAIKQEVNIFLESGPSTTLKSIVNPLLTNKNLYVCSTLDRNLEDWRSILECLANLSIRGINFDFNKIYQNPYKRIALPTYPFEKKSYWGYPADYSNTKKENIPTAELPVGFDRCVEFSFNRAVFIQEYHSENAPLLDDHVVQQTPTLPGVCQWDMAFRTGKSILKNNQICLQEVVHKAPIIIGNGKGINTRIKIEQKVVLKFEISTTPNGDSTWVENCTGKLKILPPISPKKYNIQSIKKRLSESPYQARDIYKFFSSIGLNYGESFQSIQCIWGNPQEVLTSMQLPEKARSYSHQFSFNPSLMDGALQNVLASMMMNQQLKGDTYIPFFIEEIHFYKLLPEYCYSYTQLQESATQEIIKGSTEILDSSGELLVKIKNFCLKKIESKPKLDNQGENEQSTGLSMDLKDWLFKKEFRIKPLPETTTLDEDGFVVLFMFRNPYHQLVAHKLENLNIKTIKVYPAERFSQISNQEFTIDIRKKKDYEAFFKILSQKQIEVHRFIHLWTFFDDTMESLNNLDQLEESLYRGIYSVFFISKTLGKRNRRKKNIFYVLSNLTKFSINEDPVISPEKSIISGLAKSIGIEYKDFYLRHLCMNPHQQWEEDIGKILLNELKNSDDEVVFYKKNERWVETLRPVGSNTGKFSPISFRDNGVYIITGGLGGIGREIAKYLAQKYKAKLILINRTKIIPRSQWRSWLSQHTKDNELSKKILSIKKIESDGAKVLVFNVDVGDLNQMQKCLSIAKSKFGYIHGVIHAAGVVNDGLFHNLDFDKFKSVLKPKVHGTWILNHILTLDNLDFFMLFSGAVTSFGNIGQSNYMAANSYLDAFALYRQHKNQRTVVLNWWFWAEEGFVRRLNYGTTLKNKGLKLLTKQEGINAFEQMIKSGEVQVIMKQPIITRIKSVESVIGYKDRQPARDKSQRTMIMQDPIYGQGKDNKKLFKTEVIKQYLAVKMGHITQKVIVRDQFKNSFMDIGLDSLVLVSLASQLGKEFKIELYPTVFFEYNTIDKLADFLFREYKDQLQKSIIPNDISETFPLNKQNEKEFNKDPIKTSIISRDLKESHNQLKNIAYSEKKPDEINNKMNDVEIQNLKDMKALFLEKPGTYQYLYIGKSPKPEPASREIRIRVITAGINFSDLLTVLGRYPNAPSDFPYILGNEVSGIIDKVGSEVGRFYPGQEVVALAMGQGGFAEYLVTGEDYVILKPRYINFIEAATFPVIFLTAYHALHYLGRIEKHEKILILGAAGGVGLMAVQLAKLAGAEIFAAAGSKDKIEYLRQIGVSHTINYRSSDVVLEVKRKTGGYGVDLILASSAKDEIGSMLSLLAPNGRFLEMGMVGIRDSEPFQISQFVDNQSFFSIDLKRLKPSLIKSHLNRLSNWLLEKKIKPIAHKSYHYIYAQEAFHHMATRENIGKIVISIFSKKDSKALSKSSPKGMNIAIIGMACQFPLAENLQQFWENLVKGVDGITEYPKERKRFIGKKENKVDKCWGGFIKDIEKFDCTFFSISPAEASVMDPQHRIFLTTAWEAIEDAGYGRKGALPKETGIFVGVSRQDYQNLIDQEQNPYKGHAIIGNNHSMLPSRLAYFLDLRGPAITINTACSSSLVAIHSACTSIGQKECKMAIAGGVNLCLTTDSIMAFSDMDALSPNGQCKVFDRFSDGFVSSEGIGVLVLKPLENAVIDRDYIYAVIKGSAINNDGFSNGITAPNPIAQADVIRRSLANAKVPPESISYIETHGTGTRLGDPIEIEALCKVFNKNIKRSACPIGSVKTNIGHTETAAGAAGIVKTVMAIGHGVIPPSIHFRESNPMIDFTKTPFYINDRLSPFSSNGNPLRAGISSFSFNGTNAHIIVEEAPFKEIEVEQPESPVLFTLSARTKEELADFTKKMKDFLAKEKRFKLADICYSINTGKRLMRCRLALVVGSKEELIRKLDEITETLRRNQTTDCLPEKKIYLCDNRVPKKTIFIFLREKKGFDRILSFLPKEEVFFSSQKSCEEIIQPSMDWIDSKDRERWEIFTRHYAIAQLLRSWGIEPSAALGFEIGQYVALVITGVLNLQDAFSLITKLRKNVEYQQPSIPLISPETFTTIKNFSNLIIKESSDSLSSAEIQSNIHAWNVEDYLEIGYNQVGQEMLFTEGKLREIEAIYNCIGRAYCQGIEINWDQVYLNKNREKVPLPTYPFLKKPCWFLGKRESKIKNQQPLSQDRQKTKELSKKNLGSELVNPLRASSEEFELENKTIEQEMEILKGILEKILRIDFQEIEPDIHFGQYGMDSMLMKQTVILLESHYNVPIQANLLYEYPNLKRLANYFSKLDGRKKNPGFNEEGEAHLKNNIECKDPIMRILDRFVDDKLSISKACEKIFHSLK